jgi:hypothetical protein
MSRLISRINSKYTKQTIFSYIPIKKTAKIIKYNKKLIKDLNYSVFDIKNFLLFGKIIKPISNIEDYVPIIKRITSKKKSKNNNDIIKIFCKYLNANNNEFIPQINNIKGNEYLLDNLDYFKIGFTNTFLDYFFDYNNEIDFNKVNNFCDKYGEKIKEITFIDNNFPDDIIENKKYFLMSYIIKNSNIEKIEDKYYIFCNSFFYLIFKNNFSKYYEK